MRERLTGLTMMYICQIYIFMSKKSRKLSLHIPISKFWLFSKEKWRFWGRYRKSLLLRVLMVLLGWKSWVDLCKNCREVKASLFINLFTALLHKMRRFLIKNRLRGWPQAINKTVVNGKEETEPKKVQLLPIFLLKSLRRIIHIPRWDLNTIHLQVVSKFRKAWVRPETPVTQSIEIQYSLLVEAAKGQI